MKIIENLYAFLWTNPTANNCNTYLLNCDKKILVDPGHFTLLSHVQEGLSRLSITLEDVDLVIITHAHPDHVEGIRALSHAATLIAAHREEMDFITSLFPQYDGTFDPTEPKVDLFLQEGDLQVGSSCTFRVIHTPGHSPGSICLYWPDRKALFTGDVVFNQGIGRTDLPGGDGQTLKESIKKISQLDVEYLLPGHGDIISSAKKVKRNFQDIERMWFGYL